jgi:hypothetical protein
VTERRYWCSPSSELDGEVAQDRRRQVRRRRSELLTWSGCRGAPPSFGSPRIDAQWCCGGAQGVKMAGESTAVRNRAADRDHLKCSPVEFRRVQALRSSKVGLGRLLASRWSCCGARRWLGGGGAAEPPPRAPNQPQLPDLDPTARNRSRAESIRQRTGQRRLFLLKSPQCFRYLTCGPI